MYAIIDKRKRRVYEKDGKFYIYKRVKKMINSSDVYDSPSPKKKSYIQTLKDNIEEKEKEFSNLKSDYEEKYKNILKTAQISTTDPRQAGIIINQRETIDAQKKKLNECLKLAEIVENLKLQLFDAQKDILAKEQLLKGKGGDDEYQKLKNIATSLGLRNQVLLEDFEKLKIEFMKNSELDKEQFKNQFQIEKRNSEILERELNDARLKHKTANGELEKLRIRFSEQEEIIARMNTEISEFIYEKNDNLGKAYTEIIVLKTRVAELEKSLEYSKDEVKRYKDSAYNAIATSRDISKKYNMCEDRYSKLETSHEDVVSKMESCKFLKSQIESKFGDAMNRLAKSEISKEDLESKFGDAMNRLAESELSKEDLESKFADVINRLAAAEFSKEELQTSFSTAMKSCNFEKEEKKELEATFSKAIARIQELEDLGVEQNDIKYQNAIKNLTDCTLRAQRLQIEFLEKSDELQDYKDNYQDMLDTVKKLTTSNTALIQKNQEQAEIIFNLELTSKAPTSGPDVDICAGIKQEFESYKIDTLKNSKEYQKQIDELRNVIRSLELELSSRQSETQVVSDTIIKDYEEAIKSLRLDIRSLTEEYESKEQQTTHMIEKYIYSIHNLQDNVSVLSKELNLITTENKDLKQQLKIEKSKECEACPTCEVFDNELLKKLSFRNTELSQHNVELEDTIKQLEDDLEQQERDVEKKFATLATHINQLEEEIEFRKADDDDCDRFSKRSNQTDKLEKQIEELLLDNQVLREENDKFREIVYCVVDNDTYCQQRMGDCVLKSKGEILDG
jgi:chromosome segregation ATPase